MYFLIQSINNGHHAYIPYFLSLYISLPHFSLKLTSENIIMVLETIQVLRNQNFDSLSECNYLKRVSTYVGFKEVRHVLCLSHVLTLNPKVNRL